MYFLQAKLQAFRKLLAHSQMLLEGVVSPLLGVLQTVSGWFSPVWSLIRVAWGGCSSLLSTMVTPVRLLFNLFTQTLRQLGGMLPVLRTSLRATAVATKHTGQVAQSGSRVTEAFKTVKLWSPRLKNAIDKLKQIWDKAHKHRSNTPSLTPSLSPPVTPRVLTLSSPASEAHQLSPNPHPFVLPRSPSRSMVAKMRSASSPSSSDLQALNPVLGLLRQRRVAASQSPRGGEPAEVLDSDEHKRTDKERDVGVVLQPVNREMDSLNGPDKESSLRKRCTPSDTRWSRHYKRSRAASPSKRATHT
eukprot:TRINITY_DN14627_c0_g1_i2.p1 TRINITY_DN14627_c0_g1~~TRINITY_DN14627_c0_g1_i2.p1  ORF type:complete len:303 (+),score=45.96 TRINITY_DN14627_c0_g1_i2:278-1186(+)